MLKIVLLFVFLGLCSPVLAQTVQEMEESAFLLCQDRLGGFNEAEACTDWIVEGVCRSTYISRIDQVAKLTTPENLRRYREVAESRLSASCEPMSAVILNLDILKDIPKDDTQARLNRWARAFHWAPHLAPNQRQILAAEAANAPEFAQILAHRDMQKQMKQAAAESAGFLPEISDQTLFFLHQLEQIRPDLMTAETHAVLLSDELLKAQYKMASSRMNTLDVTLLSADHKARLMPMIANFAVQIFGRADLSQAVCFKEYPASKVTHPKRAWLEALDIPKVKGLISGHLMTIWLMQCNHEAIGKRLADLWLNHATDPNLHALTQALLTNLETNHDLDLGLAIAENLADLNANALTTIKKQYGIRLSSFLMSAAISALNTGNAKFAQRALEAIAKFVSPAKESERLFYLGRTYVQLKDETKARQIWAQILDQSPNTSWGIQSAYLTIQSFQKSGKKAEAQALMQQMKDALPENIWF